MHSFSLFILFMGCYPEDKTPIAEDSHEANPADVDADGYSSEEDCNDNSSAIYPGATEICDGLDNNCDQTIDESGAQGEAVFYADMDGDSYGNPNSQQIACQAPTNYVSDNTDCNDNNAGIHPSATEVCDGQDNDCDGVSDGANADGASLYYADSDGDNYGNSHVSVLDCSAPAGYVADNTDCDDTTTDAHPGAIERCDNIDNNCDNNIDEGVTITFYADNDGDSYGRASSSITACSAPSGYASNADDCDDFSAAVNPTATEVCNTTDDDCDGQSDEGVTSTFYADTDRDSFGNATATTQACAASTGWVADSSDCNDGDVAINPIATEICDGVDNDCDTDIDDDDANLDTSTGYTYYTDSDNDGYGDASHSFQFCVLQAGLSADDSDCNDGDGSINPGATEVCEDEVDNDCDGGWGACNTGTQSLPTTAIATLRGGQYTSYTGTGGDYAGGALAFMDDTDGDGDQDLWVGAYGSKELGHDRGWARLVGGSLGDRAITSIYLQQYVRACDSCTTGNDIASGGDYDGDGTNDVVIGALLDSSESGTGSGTAHVLSGSTGTTYGGFYTTYEAYISAGLSFVPDLDNDGMDELLIAASGAGTADQGQVALIMGGTSSGNMLSSTIYSTLWSGAASSDFLGGGPTGRNLTAGDITGDGISEVVMTSDVTSGNAGGLFLEYGPPPSGSVNVGASDLIVWGAAGERFGTGPRISGDLNGDGYDDLVVGARSSNRSYLLFGSSVATLGTLSSSAMDARINGPTASDFGFENASGDINQDGVADLVVGAMNDDTAGTNAGAVYLFNGPLSAGTFSYSTADLVLQGASNDLVGSALELGDYDGDSYLDIAAGAYGRDSYSGAVYIWSTESW